MSKLKITSIKKINSTNSTSGNIFSHDEPEELKSPSKKAKLFRKRQIAFFGIHLFVGL